jgi:hypothetical protein
MIKGLFALLVACTLMVPHITPARGGEATVGFGATRYGQSQLGSWAALPLPPVPHLDIMPWLSSGSALRGPRVDVLFSPKLDTLGQFLVQPAIPGTQFSWSAEPFDARTMTD